LKDYMLIYRVLVVQILKGFRFLNKKILGLCRTGKT
jgi:hypothetical protein